jgi:hypothetical protein
MPTYPEYLAALESIEVLESDLRIARAVVAAWQAQQAPPSYGGKGVFIWDLAGVNRALGGGWTEVPPGVLAATLRNAGIQRIEIKVSNGTTPYASPSRAYIDAIRANWSGKIFGWGFMVGVNPGTEGMVLAKQVVALGLDGGISDIETAFERQPDAPARAEKQALWYKAFTDKPLGLCSWPRYISPSGAIWHPIAVAERFMALADFGMPMSYWSGEGTACPAFAKEVHRQWRTITDKPIIQAGRAYTGEGGTLRPESMVDFERAVRETGEPGISWWSLKHALGLQWPWDLIGSQQGW